MSIWVSTGQKQNYLMPTRRETANDDILFWTLKVLQSNPALTERTLAKALGIHGSGDNFCIKVLVEKGQVRMGNFSRNAKILIATGRAKKAVLTLWFLRHKKSQNEKLREDIEALPVDAEQPLASSAVRTPPMRRYGKHNQVVRLAA